LNVPAVVVRVLSGFDDPALSEEDWARVQRTGDTDTLAIAREYQRTWWECFGRGRLLLLLASREGRPVALAPFFTDGGMVFFLCPEDFLDVVGDVGDPQVLDALLEEARRRVDGFAGFRLYFVPDASRTGARLQAAAARLGLDCLDEGALPAPAIDLAGRPDAALDATRRKSLLRHEHAMRREGELAVEHVRSAAHVLPQLPEFFAQHVARRSALGQRSIFLEPSHRAFYERIAERGGERGWIRFSRLDWNGRPAAFHFGFRYGGRFLYGIPSFDVGLAKRSPGEVLLRHVMLSAIEEGATTFDFGIGGEAYKYRFATHETLMRTWGLYPKTGS
jgi:CelD/BcsL family acetyltransferase involved in cellulose biosynthesis